MAHIKFSRLCFFTLFLVSFFLINTDLVLAQTQSMANNLRIRVDERKLPNNSNVSFFIQRYNKKESCNNTLKSQEYWKLLLSDRIPNLSIYNLQDKFIIDSYKLNPETAVAITNVNELSSNSSKDISIITDSNIREYYEKHVFVTYSIFKQNAYTNSGYLTLFIVLCVITTLIPLLIGFHWRWFLGSLVACIFWGPIGLIFSFYVVGLILFDSDKIETYSPRELMEEFAESKVIIAIVIILLIVLTAFSILGGIILVGIIYFYYKFTLLFMPNSSEKKFDTIPSTQITHDSSSSSNYYSSDDDNWRTNDYDDNDDNTDDDDHDDDDDDKGSPWDGWLVKW